MNVVYHVDYCVRWRVGLQRVQCNALVLCDIANSTIVVGGWVTVKTVRID